MTGRARWSRPIPWSGYSWYNNNSANGCQPPHTTATLTFSRNSQCPRFYFYACCYNHYPNLNHYYYKFLRWISPPRIAVLYVIRELLESNLNYNNTRKSHNWRINYITCVYLTVDIVQERNRNTEWSVFSVCFHDTTVLLVAGNVGAVEHGKVLFSLLYQSYDYLPSSTT